MAEINKAQTGYQVSENYEILNNNIYQINQELTDHVGDTNNPHSVTAAQVGLGNVNNTSDADKPVSTAQQEALSLKQDITDDTLETEDKTVPGAINEINSDLKLKQSITDESLETTSKTIPGAINEINSSIESHIANTNNPHSVTPEQISALGNSGQQVLSGSLVIENDGAEAPGNLTVQGSLTVQGGISGQVGWNSITGKPFSTVGSEFTVSEDALTVNSIPYSKISGTPDLSNVVTTNGVQTISGLKYFSNGILTNSGLIISQVDNPTSASDARLIVAAEGAFGVVATPTLGGLLLGVGTSADPDLGVDHGIMIGGDDLSGRSMAPYVGGSGSPIDLGTSQLKYGNLYLSGKINDLTLPTTTDTLATLTDISTSISQMTKKYQINMNDPIPKATGDEIIQSFSQGYRVILEVSDTDATYTLIVLSAASAGGIGIISAAISSFGAAILSWVSMSESSDYNYSQFDIPTSTTVKYSESYFETGSKYALNDIYGNEIDTTYAKVSDVYTKSQVDSSLSSTVKTSGSQSITGDLTIVKEGTTTGNLVVQGNLTVQGSTVTNTTESLVVQDNMIVTNGTGTTLTSLSGIGIRTNSSDVYGIVYDPVANSVDLGLGSLDSNNEFTFNEGEGYPVAIRASSTTFTDGHLVVWNSTNKTLVDGGEVPTALPNPYALTVGSKTYTGSSAVTLTASDLGALTKTQADGYYQPKGTYLSSIPVATSSSLGGVKVGSGTASGTNFNLLLDSNQVGIVSIPTATTSAPGLMSSTDKSKLNGLPSSISYPVTSVNSKTGAVTLSASDVGALTKTQADGYYQAKGSYLTSIPQASSTSLGGIKVGYTTSGKNYAISLDSSGAAYVNVPWTDTNTNTTYTFASGSGGSFTVTPSGGQAQTVSIGTPAQATNATQLGGIAASNYVTTNTTQTISGSKTFTSPPTLDASPDGLIATLGSKGRLGSVSGASVEGPALYANSGSAIYLISQSGARPKAATGSWLGPQNIEDIAYVSDLSDYVPTTRTINNKALSSNISLTASDVGALTKTQADGYYQAKGSYLTSIPQASTGSLGGIKVGYTTSGKNYAVNVDTSGNAYVNVPWTYTNTTYSFSNGSDGSFTVTPSGGSAQKVSTGALTKSSADGYYQPKGSYLTSIPAATTSTIGGVKLGNSTTQTVAANSVSATASRTYAIQQNSSGQLVVNVPWTEYSIFNRTSNGLVPTPGGSIYSTTKYLREDGTWQVPPDTKYSVFNRTSNGLVPTPEGSIYSTTKYLREDGTWQVPPDTNTDTKVTQTHSTGNANYPILLKNGTGTDNVTNTTLFDANVYVNPSTGTLTASKVYGAVFNDYAEYRISVDDVPAGYIVTEDPNNPDYVVLCKTKKPRSKMFVVTDTYGTCIGEKNNSVPVALAGRVLVKFNDTSDLKVGDYVGSDSYGMGRRVGKFEALLHPSRVIGTVSSIPNYDTWGTDNVKVDGRIWVNLK